MINTCVDGSLMLTMSASVYLMIDLNTYIFFLTIFTLLWVIVRRKS